ncbi:MAG TPA: sorbosone dehydrogenase family protein [Cytophagales bacterium]|nr:sorbosone dehydrogenase family protein [Cytophagales bacterium]
MKKNLIITALILLVSVLTSFTFLTEPEKKEESKISLDKIKLPAGFKIEVFAENVPNARSMALSPRGVLYVGTRTEGKVYAIVDKNKDFKAEEVHILASGLNMPNGVAFKDGDLYVAEVSRILRFDEIEKDLKNPPSPKIIYDKFPTKEHHGWKFISFGPDGKLYVPVGAPCNICEHKDSAIYASITRMNPDGTGFEIYANGVRNSVGFTWDPRTKEMWFTENGRDMLGNDIPPCELNHVTKPGQHFGYPYCHAGYILDPEFGSKGNCKDFTPPAMKLGPHVAPLGIRFYQGKMFPEKYKNQLFIAEHGSWNRDEKIGYRLTMVTVKDNKAVDYSVFAEGWLSDDKKEVSGRPVDVQEMPDGSLLVSDDHAGAIYRITYKK